VEVGLKHKLRLEYKNGKGEEYKYKGNLYISEIYTLKVTIQIENKLDTSLNSNSKFKWNLKMRDKRKSGK
jgi:hypothetical protein